MIIITFKMIMIIITVKITYKMISFKMISFKMISFKMIMISSN